MRYRLRGELATFGLLLALGLAWVPAVAQVAELELGVHRDFGFSAGGRIQGAFSLTVRGREDLVMVRYLLDGQVMGVVSEPPFRFRFNTGDYPLGPHVLFAIGVTTSGEEIRSNERRLEFVSADESWRAARQIALPLLGLVFLATVLGLVGPVMLGGRGRRMRPGEYGAAGGAVCPRCGLPFARHLISPNLVVGKLERCPHCGKWSVVARASPQALQQAETRWAIDASRGRMDMQDEHGRLRRLLEESKYED